MYLFISLCITNPYRTQKIFFGSTHISNLFLKTLWLYKAYIKLFLGWSNKDWNILISIYLMFEVVQHTTKTLLLTDNLYSILCYRFEILYFLQVHSSLADVYLDLHMTSEAIAELETALTIRQYNKPGLEGDINRSATHQTLIRLYRLLGVRVKMRSRAN